MAMKWAVAFPLLLVAEAALVIGALEAFVDHEFAPVAAVVASSAVTLAFLALAAGYMLRKPSA